MNKRPTLPKVCDLGGGEFESLMHQLLLAHAEKHGFDYKPHGVNGAGDEGIDGLALGGGVPGLKGATGFQYKWLTGNLSRGGNAEQIKDSLAEAAASSFKLKHWVLITPEPITPVQKKWLQEQSPRKGLTVHHWGHEQISSLFTLRPDLDAQYYPETAGRLVQKIADDKVCQAYLHWVIRECSPLKLRVIDTGAAQTGKRPIELANVYVDLDVGYWVSKNSKLSKSFFERNIGERSESIRANVQLAPDMRRITVLEVIAYHSRLVLLGPPGSGKSTVATFLALNLAAARLGKKANLQRLGKDWTQGPLLPVPVTLREFAATLAPDLLRGRASQLWEFLEAEWIGKGLAKSTGAGLRQVANDSGALFLLDGLDEAREASTRERVLEAVTEFAESAGPHCRFVLTARPYAWEQASEFKQKWPNAYTVAEFSGEQIQHFGEQWFQAVHAAGWSDVALAKKRTAELADAVKREDIKPLASNPLLLTLMATLLANGTRLPDDRVDLYAEVVTLLLQRWSQNIGADRGLLDALNIPGLTLNHIRARMQEIAYEAHDRHAGQAGVANIGEGALSAALKPLLRNDANKADRTIDYIEKRTGLLIGQGALGKERQFTFPHRTFQEFLAACWLAEQPDLPLRAAQLAKINPAHWREVLVFAARQAGAARGVPTADALVNSQSLDEWRKTHPVDDHDWRAALLAGEQLLEVGLAVVDSHPAHQAVKTRVAGWLAGLVEAGALPVKERARAGVALGRLGDPRPGVGVKDGRPDIDWIHIPAGPFLYDDPPKTCALITKPYRISRYPVTVAQYQAFVDAGGYGERRYWTKDAWKWRSSNKITGPDDGPSVLQTPNHPRVKVSWFEAIAFCRWLSEQTNQAITLPTDFQWERAARHTDGREYPWGKEPMDPDQHGNVEETGLECTSAVGLLPAGRAKCGALDLAGNVWEWCSSADHDPEAKRASPVLEGDDARVVRGGSWYYPLDLARCSVRDRFDPVYSDWNLGVRLVASPFFPVL